MKSAFGDRRGQRLGCQFSPAIGMRAPVLRTGLSLLEVVIATVILSASLAVLGQLVDQGRVAASRSAFELDALVQCESVMAATCTELTTGFAIADFALEVDDLVSEVSIDTTDSESLMRVTVQTKHFDQQGRKTASAKLVRLVFVPLLEEADL